MRHNSLSDTDMDCISGTELMERLQRNRLVIIYDRNDKHASAEDLGLTKCEGLFYMRKLANRDDTHEILFELITDLQAVEESLSIHKLGQD